MRYWILLLPIFLLSCNYHKPLANAELIVPEFIQSDHPELYQKFLPKISKKKDIAAAEIAADSYSKNNKRD